MIHQLFPARAGNWRGVHEFLFAADSQLRLGHELAAVASAGQKTMASDQIQGEASHHLGGTSQILAGENNSE